MKSMDDSTFRLVAFVVPILTVGVLLIVMYTIIRNKQSRKKSTKFSAPRLFQKIICPKKYKNLDHESNLGIPMEDYSNTTIFDVDTINMEMTTATAILECMEKLMSKDNNDFEVIMSQSRPDDSSVALHPKNIKKNKDSNIVPYDSSRFEIALPTSSGNDYVNASIIKDHFIKNLTYIMTQIPFSEETTKDFWQMVWESKSGIIACMLDPEEFKNVDSDIWPFMTTKNDRYDIELLSANTTNSSYLVNTLYIRNRSNTHTRIIIIFCFLNYNKFGLPNSLEEFSFFRRIIDKSYQSSPGTIIVSCSNGGGKSGLFIVVDLTLKRLYANSKQIDLRACIEFLQEYRTVVIENQEQYYFAISTIAEEMRIILKKR